MEINKIYNLDVSVGLKEIPNESIDLIVTDPPYLINYASNRSKDKDYKFSHEILNDTNNDLISWYLHRCYEVLKNDCAAYVFCSSKTLDFFLQESKDAGFKVQNIIVWDKCAHTAGDLEHQFGCQYEPLLLLNKGKAKIRGTRFSDVWQCPRVHSAVAVHQNQKPLALIERCIESHSDKGNLVLDGFMGSGTTAVACIRTKRNFVGFELDKNYYEIAKKRIETERSQPMLF